MLDLYDRDLKGHIFRGVDLREADLRESDLRHTIWEGVAIEGVKLDGARLNWCAKPLLAEIIRQAAVADPTGLPAAKIAKAVADDPNATWVDVYTPEWPFDWVVSVLRPFFQDGDPDVVRDSFIRPPQRTGNVPGGAA